jgi:hypothetical protein
MIWAKRSALRSEVRDFSPAVTLLRGPCRDQISNRHLIGKLAQELLRSLPIQIAGGVEPAGGDVCLGFPYHQEFIHGSDRASGAPSQRSALGVSQPSMSPLLRAVWHGLRGEWETAHQIAQDDMSAKGAWSMPGCTASRAISPVPATGIGGLSGTCLKAIPARKVKTLVAFLLKR